jgi:hypothetical protein
MQINIQGIVTGSFATGFRPGFVHAPEKEPIDVRLNRLARIETMGQAQRRWAQEKLELLMLEL